MDIEGIKMLLSNSTDEDKLVIDRFLSAIAKKQETNSATYLGHVFDWEKNYLNQETLEMVMPIGPLFKNAHNITHGGIITTLLDTALGSIAAYQVPKDEGVVTTEMKVNFLKPATGTLLKCVATLVHKGRKICVTEGKVFNDQNELVAIATGSFYFVKMRS